MDVLLLQTGGGNPALINMLFIGAMLAVFYFFMINPQRKRQREQRTFMEGLEKGEEVVTASGILGRITKIDGEVVTLEVSPKQYIRVTRNSISKDMTEGVFGELEPEQK